MDGMEIVPECLLPEKQIKKIYDLLKTTYECLHIGIKEAIPGKTFGDIGHKIQEYAEAKNYSVVRDFCGHGIGKGISYSSKCTSLW